MSLASGRGMSVGCRTLLEFFRLRASTEIDGRFRNTLKKLGIINLAQIGSVICSLAVLGANGSELWVRCSDGAW